MPYDLRLVHDSLVFDPHQYHKVDPCFLRLEAMVERVSGKKETIISWVGVDRVCVCVTFFILFFVTGSSMIRDQEEATSPAKCHLSSPRLANRRREGGRGERKNETKEGGKKIRFPKRRTRQAWNFVHLSHNISTINTSIALSREKLPHNPPPTPTNATLKCRDISSKKKKNKVKKKPPY